ncbi:hypothetical protein FF2_034610 [Malus domestica]
MAKENFVGAGAVDVGGVEEGDASRDGMVDESDHVFIGLGRAIEGGHAQAAKSLSGDLEALRTQLDLPYYSYHRWFIANMLPGNMFPTGSKNAMNDSGLQAVGLEKQKGPPS